MKYLIENWFGTVMVLLAGGYLIKECATSMQNTPPSCIEQVVTYDPASPRAQNLTCTGDGAVEIGHGTIRCRCPR